MQRLFSLPRAYSRLLHAMLDFCCFVINSPFIFLLPKSLMSRETLLCCSSVSPQPWHIRSPLQTPVERKQGFPPIGHLDWFVSSSVNAAPHSIVFCKSPQFTIDAHIIPLEIFFTSRIFSINLLLHWVSSISYPSNFSTQILAPGVSYQDTGKENPFSG